jgi:hypothetical protein
MLPAPQPMSKGAQQIDRATHDKGPQEKIRVETLRSIALFPRNCCDSVIAGPHIEVCDAACAYAGH